MVEESVWLETVEKTAKQKAKFEDSKWFLKNMRRRDFIAYLQY